MRPGLAYSGPNSKSDADVFLICYSIGNPGSLLEATEKWAPELEQHCPGVPFLLVGCKSDVRADVSKILNRVCGFIKVVGHRTLCHFLLSPCLLSSSFSPDGSKGPETCSAQRGSNYSRQIGFDGRRVLGVLCERESRSARNISNGNKNSLELQGCF